MRERAEASVGMRIEGARLAAGARVVFVRGDIESRCIAGTDGGIDAGAGPGGAFEFGEEFVGRGLAIAMEGIAISGARPLAAAKRTGCPFGVNPGSEARQGG